MQQGQSGFNSHKQTHADQNTSDVKEEDAEDGRLSPEYHTSRSKSKVVHGDERSREDDSFEQRCHYYCCLFAICFYNNILVNLKHNWLLYLAKVEVLSPQEKPEILALVPRATKSNFASYNVQFTGQN